MESDSILVEKGEGLVVITLNRPERLNAFTAEMNRSLQVALAAAGEAEDCRAILITGAGRAFCAGQDLNDPGAAPDQDLGDLLEDLFNPLIRSMRALEKPIVCAVNGVAAGAGASLAMACDIVLAAKSAKFMQAFVKIGLVPDCGGTWFLTHLLGEARAKALAMTGMPLSAETAADWGMIWRAVEDEALMEEARKLAGELATGPTVALGLIKQAVQSAGSHSLNNQLELERDLQSEAGKTPDYAEGVAAFTGRRQPNFTGKRK